MDNEKLKISDELLDNLSVDNLIDLKVEVDDMVSEIDRLIEKCDATLNS